ncbi:hypothetical protein AL537_13700 [Vibrio diabolicus]|nr:hypothetical protein AL537_13700 [Vibrio diabolicus]
MTALGVWVQVGLCFQGGTASLRWWRCSHLNSVLGNQNQYVIMNKEHSEAFILEIDKVLAPSGFKFIKSRGVWERKVGKVDVEWFHLNFGLTVLNPSFGVKYKDIEKVLPREMRCIGGVSRMLSSITGNSYTDAISPIAFAYMVKQLLPIELEKLRDRKRVIESLKSEDVKVWPVFSYSTRIRLLPLLLSKTSPNEAIKYMAYFESELRTRDQLIPNYDAFKGYLLKHLKV